MLIESSEEAFELIKDRAEAIWRKVQGKTIRKEELMRDITFLEKEVEILKKLEGFSSLEEEQQYIVLFLTLKFLRQEYDKFMK